VRRVDEPRGLPYYLHLHDLKGARTMISQPTQAARLMFAAIVVVFATAFFTCPALARIVTNTVDPVAVVVDDGRHLVVTGPITCTANERRICV